MHIFVLFFILECFGTIIVVYKFFGMLLTNEPQQQRNIHGTPSYNYYYWKMFLKIITTLLNNNKNIGFQKCFFMCFHLK